MISGKYGVMMNAQEQVGHTKSEEERKINSYPSKIEWCDPKQKHLRYLAETEKQDFE